MDDINMIVQVCLVLYSWTDFDVTVSDISLNVKVNSRAIILIESFDYFFLN